MQGETTDGTTWFFKIKYSVYSTVTQDLGLKSHQKTISNYQVNQPVNLTHKHELPSQALFQGGGGGGGYLVNLAKWRRVINTTTS